MLKWPQTSLRIWYFSCACNSASGDIFFEWTKWNLNFCKIWIYSIRVKRPQISFKAWYLNCASNSASDDIFLDWPNEVLIFQKMYNWWHDTN